MLNKFIKVIFCILVSSNLFGAQLTAKDWQIITGILEQPLWQKEKAYNASHYLMLPLHASFKLNQKNVQQAFNQHFQRMLANRHELPSGLKGRLIRLQYLYLAAEYLRLAGKNAPPNLAKFLSEDIKQFWFVEPAWQWNHKPFIGMKKRLDWKFENSNIKPRYYSAVIDEELHLMGAAADLDSYYEMQGIKTEENFTKEIIGYTYRIFNDRGRWLPSGGYLFQEGVWADHPNYQYAGNKLVKSDLPIKIVPDIAMDSSHSHRLPLWLQSFENADTINRNFYKQVRKGLAIQLFNKVIVPPSKGFRFYRTKNFFCGHNGVYRYKYSSKMNGGGYGPYALSGTLLIGWWVFLPDDRVQVLYKNLTQNYTVFLKWVSDIDPYGKENWTSQDNYPLVLPVLLKLAMNMTAK